MKKEEINQLVCVITEQRISVESRKLALCGLITSSTSKNIVESLMDVVAKWQSAYEERCMPGGDIDAR